MNTENNILLAEFMGGLYNGEGRLSLQNNEIWLPSFGVCNINNNGKTLRYNSCWNWLMEVVEKIESVDNQRFCFDISLGGAIIEDTLNDFNPVVEIVVESKKMAVYQACIDFVKWWNNANPK